MSKAIHVIPEPLPTTSETRFAAYLLTDYLERLGVEVVFGLTGHTVIAMLDALGRSRIRYVSTRHEQVAAHAADGYARATGKPGVLLTHLGPGLTNAATGVANAALDSIPMVVIAGDVQSYFHGRHPHQEVNLHQDADQYQIYRPFCKRVYRVEHARDLPRIIERAFHLCQAGRPGPVLVDVPMDIFSSSLPIDAFNKVPAEIARPSIDEATAERIVAALAAAERPVLYAGGGVLSARGSAELVALAEALELPIAHTLMGKGVVREDHPLLLGMTGFWGTPIANEKCRTADLILAVGTRFAEANSSSWDPRFTFNIPPTRLVHIDADVAELGRNFPTELGVVADAKLALAGLARAAAGVKHRNRGSLRLEIAQGRRAFAANWADQYSSSQYPMRPERILAELRKAVPENGFIVTDVGWNKNGVGQQFPITVPGTFITPSGLATMGFGPAAALGVKLGQPDRAVVALIGDGAFGSNPSVVATAMEAGLGVVWLVMDNSAFGTIAGLTNMHYGWEFGCLFEVDGEKYQTDFAQIARGYGADGIFIKSADELGPALTAALASGRPTVIQAPMENAPTPTPGHWDINCVYRKGSQLAAVAASSVIETRTHVRWVPILALIAVGTAINYLDRTVLGIAAPHLTRDLGLTGTQMGFVFSAFSWSYAALQIPGGIFLDRFGTRLTYFIAIAFWSFFTGLMGLVSSLGGLIATRLGVGVFEAPCFPANSRILATWFPQHERARANSVYSVGMNFGLGFLSVPLFWITQQFGWRGLFFIVGALGIAFSFVWWALYRNPNESTTVNRAELDYIEAGGGGEYKGQPLDFQWGHIGALLRHRQVIGASIGQFGGNSTLVFFLTWFPTYLVKARGMTFIKAGFMTSVPYLAAATGVVIGGYVSDMMLKRTGSANMARKLPIVSGMLLASCIILANYVPADNNALVIAIMSLAFFGQGMTNLGWTVVSDIAPKKLIGLTGGLFNFVTNLAGIITPVVIGATFDATGTFVGPLVYIAAVALLGAFAYSVIIGDIHRLEIETDH